MTVVRRLLNKLWTAIAKTVLPDPVFQIDNLHVTQEDGVRERLQRKAEQRLEQRLRARWSVTESMADMAEMMDHARDEQDNLPEPTRPLDAEGAAEG